MHNVHEDFDAMFHRIILVVVLLIPLFVDTVISRNLLTECVNYVRKVKASRTQERPSKNKDVIKRGIKFDMRSTLITWCPVKSFRPDVIMTEFGKFRGDPKANVAWDAVPIFSSGQAMHGRVVAMFATEQQALNAAKELGKLSKYAFTFQLHEIIDVLIEAERRLPVLGNFTRVLISSRSPLSSQKRENKLRSLLNACGEVTRLNFVESNSYSESLADTEDLILICDVAYKYASQAYLAFYLVDGFSFRSTSRKLLSAKVVETKKEKLLLSHKLRSKFKEMVEDKKAVSCLKRLP